MHYISDDNIELKRGDVDGCDGIPNGYVRSLQEDLTALGFDLGSIDGDFGNKTHEACALFQEICRRVEVPVQHYAHRTDLPCGSTIGPITATLLGIPTVDVGNPMLSMHSARELAGAADPAAMTRVLARYLRS